MPTLKGWVSSSGSRVTQALLAWIGGEGGCGVIVAGVEVYQSWIGAPGR